MKFIAKHKLYLTADRKQVVKASDPKSGYLFVKAGGVVSDADVKAYGIGSDLLTPVGATAQAETEAPQKQAEGEGSTESTDADEEPPKKPARKRKG